MLEAGTATHSYVQIPLWTIVTLLRGRKTNPEQERSDSSMDDCNPAHNFFDSRLSLRSDSSMDDCNTCAEVLTSLIKVVQIPLWTIVTIEPSLWQSRRYRVQIPLWTIVTMIMVAVFSLISGSDSSMDDCNTPLQLRDFCFLRSDSSMDDCNGRWRRSAVLHFHVQIPLWTIVTF